MFAPGVRVVRGPDWNWKNQGNNLFNLRQPVGCL